MIITRWWESKEFWTRWL